MTRRHVIAVALAVLAMLAALAQPLWVRTTGVEVALDIEPVDPLSFFRGNYVDLTYNVADLDVGRFDSDQLIYVTLDNARPARAIRLSESRPDLAEDERCLRGERIGSRIAFPALEQYFVTSDEGRRLETNLTDMVGIVKTTSSCRGILVNIELE